MNREEMLATIDAAYAARAADDVEALTRVLAPDATFEFAGEPGPLHSLPGSTGPEDSEPAIAALMRLISTSGVERLQAVIEGNRATTVSRRHAASIEGGSAVIETWKTVCLHDRRAPFSKRDAWIGASVMISASIALSALGIAFDRIIFAPMESWVRTRWGLNSA